MKGLSKISATILLIIVFPFIGNTQCKEYIEANYSTQLEPYVIDGNFIAPILTEGDSIDLNRTFYSDQDYRVAVYGFDFL